MLCTFRGKTWTAMAISHDSIRHPLLMNFMYATEAVYGKFERSCAHEPFSKHVETHHQKCMVVKLKATGYSKVILLM